MKYNFAVVETKDWIIFVGPLIGVIVGGAITTVAKLLELSLNQRHKRFDAHLDRIQKLHLTLGEYRVEFSNLMINIPELINNDQPQNVKVDELARRHVLVSRKEDEIRTMIRLYFPDEKDKYGNLHTAFALFSREMFDCVGNARSPSTLTTYNQLDKTCQELEASIEGNMTGLLKTPRTRRFLLW